MPSGRIAYLGAADNWWAAGPTGPCGPDTEIFYWVGEGFPSESSNKGNDPKNWLEILEQCLHGVPTGSSRRPW
jgi:alanyl-tRNA synthetase